MSEEGRLEPIGSNLALLDALSDEDIDLADAPMPDLADWVRYAQPFDASHGQGVEKTDDPA